MQKALGFIRVIIQFALCSAVGYAGEMTARKISPVLESASILFFIMLVFNVITGALVVCIVGRIFGIKWAWDCLPSAIIVGGAVILVGVLVDLGGEFISPVFHDSFFNYHYFWTAAGTTTGFNLVLRANRPRNWQ